MIGRHRRLTGIGLAVVVVALTTFVFTGETSSPVVLEFPETGVDDIAAYEGHTTRFFKDSRGNALQVYVSGNTGRVVHVWADAVNESAAFNVRDAQGAPATIMWGRPDAIIDEDGAVRSLSHELIISGSSATFGWFVLGTMRQERDFQYWRIHERPYGDTTFVLAELTNLVHGMDALPAGTKQRHLDWLGASSIADLANRLHPSIQNQSDRSVLVEQRSLDGRNTLSMLLEFDDGVRIEPDGETVTVRGDDDELRLRVTVSTDSPALTPVDGNTLFNAEFRAFMQRRRAAEPASVALRRLERAVAGLELLSYEEKVMAALPNYATYFGRDGIMATLMLEPISSPDVLRHMIVSVLRKLGPEGDVSHEEALGGQAIRQRAGQYAELTTRWQETGDDTLIEQAESLLVNMQETIEDYHMVDDDLQFPILVDRYLSKLEVPESEKRDLLLSTEPAGWRRVDRLVANLALVARWTEPYANDPSAENLIGFHRFDRGDWLPGSWRDSRVGYANGRYAMDVNAIWAPKALAATASILTALDGLGVDVDEVIATLGANADALRQYRTGQTDLREATRTWQSAREHFVVQLGPENIGPAVMRFLSIQSDGDASYWAERAHNDLERSRPLWFEALSLNEDHEPIPALHTDLATDLFLTDYTTAVLRGETAPEYVLTMVDPLTRPFPVGLLVEGVGVAVVNDVYADSIVQRRFREDAYHAPTVVWGREVNLVMLGLARQIQSAYEDGALRSTDPVFVHYVQRLREVLDIVSDAVDASGMSHNELWSYEVVAGTVQAVRYGVSSDIQLWNLTDLAVAFVLDQLPAP